MSELVKVTETCAYIQSPAKIGLVRCGQDHVCLIDSGNDRDAGKKTRKILDDNGWTLDAVYNTHSHADHIGGNRYLQMQTGCRIYASGIERGFAQHPVLEPSYLYGANPPKELRHKFLLAQPSEVLELTQDCLPEGLSMLPLPGHSWDMVGFRTADDVVFLADCLSSEETLKKYRISFLVDVQAYLDTLKDVMNMKAKCFIPSHAQPTDDIAPLARFNIDRVHEIADTILKICTEPASFEFILKKLFALYSLTMTFEQHALVGSTIRSYLAWLHELGALQAVIDDNIILWKA